jgi:DnaJ-class molecular chaperone
MTLGLSGTASAQDVRRAYLRLAATWHPDKWATADAQDQATAAARFEDIKTSYDALAGTPAFYNVLDS